MLIDEAMVIVNRDSYREYLEEAAIEKHLKVELLDVEKFIKVNTCPEVTNPVFFEAGGRPTDDGLLSQTLFGITKAERSGIYGCVDLGGKFMHPLVYKTLIKLNGKIEEVVNGTDYFSIDKSGDLVVDPDGDTGIDWLRKNFDQIKFKKNDSPARNSRIDFINKYKDMMWISKYVIIPPYYRDVESKDNGLGVGEINKLYSSLIIASKAVKETTSYGLTLSDTTKARVQNILLQIFDWFGNGTVINGQETPAILPGKLGLIRHGLMAKTVDYSVRLVMSAPDVAVEDIDDFMVDMDHAGLPLSAALCNFKPFVMFWLRRFFENQFAGRLEYPIAINDTDTITVPLLDYQIAFSDTELNKQIDRFINGYANRFIPIELPVDKAAFAEKVKNKELKTIDGRTLSSVKEIEHFFVSLTGFKLKTGEAYKKDNTYLPEQRLNRPLTWCDIFYMAATDVSADKMVLVTRFPIDSYLNQYPTKVNIKSTVKTEPMVIKLGFDDNEKFYKWYPMIREEDMYTNTSPLFEDTLSISNGLIAAMGMDYDGDTATVKPLYTIEANQECEKISKSKVQIIGMDGYTTRNVSKENLLCLYELTIQPDDSIKFVNPEF